MILKKKLYMISKYLGFILGAVLFIVATLLDGGNWKEIWQGLCTAAREEE
jgi:hypothetical protein